MNSGIFSSSSSYAYSWISLIKLEEHVGILGSAKIPHLPAPSLTLEPLSIRM